MTQGRGAPDTPLGGRCESENPKHRALFVEKVNGDFLQRLEDW